MWESDEGAAVPINFDLTALFGDEKLTDGTYTRVFTVPNMIMDSKQPKTVGSLAAKNTERMISEGKLAPPKPKERPFWRNTDKPVNIDGWSEKQKNRYIYEGKKS